MTSDPKANAPKPYVVLEQQVLGELDIGQENAKRICQSCSGGDFGCDPNTEACTTTNISPTDTEQTLYGVEVFYSYSPITVLGNFLGSSFARTFYERSIF
jgi:hypothetical protein